MADRDCVHGQLARAEFEKWVKNPHMLGRCHAPGSEDRYEVSETQYAWRAWQAALESRVRELEAERDKLLKRLKRATELCASQAEDEGIWFIAETITEDYLQRALRNLHRAIEE